VSASEKTLDRLFEIAFRDSREFRQWLLKQTKFADRPLRLVLLRADHPWYQSKATKRQSETDILAVLEDERDGTRVALHFENKTWTGKFEVDQPALYHERARDWIGVSKWGNYCDYETVLVAPRVFVDRNEAAAALFDRHIAYEELADFIPEFAGSVPTARK